LDQQEKDLIQKSTQLKAEMENKEGPKFEDDDKRSLLRINKTLDDLA
jgi:hypothetical protein